jgi:hypothetical protein
MSAFGAKEVWMEPMNRFLQASRPEFKAFVDQICSVPSERPNQAVSASYATPIQILARLPATSREGFPSLPFLIDSAKSFANLASLWLRKCPSDIEAKLDKDPALRRFHELCKGIRQRTQNCLESAEAAERPSGELEPQWKRLLEERERSATDYRSAISQPLSPVEDIVPGISDIPIPDRRDSKTSRPQSLSPPSMNRSDNLWQSGALQGSTSSVIDQSRAARSPPTRTIDTQEGHLSSSQNLSTAYLDGTDYPRMRTTAGSRDGPAKSRIKDFVSGSSRRRAKEPSQIQHFEEGNDL